MKVVMTDRVNDFGLLKLFLWKTQNSVGRSNGGSILIVPFRSHSPESYILRGGKKRNYSKYLQYFSCKNSFRIFIKVYIACR